MAKKAESGGYARLKGDLAQKTPGSFYVLYGEEDYLRRYYLSMLRRQLVDGPTEDFNFHRLTSENFSMQVLSESLEALPMMAERTMIQVDDVDLFALPEDDRTQLAALFSDIPDYACLVLVYADFKPDKRKKKLWDAMEKNAVLAEFAYQTERDLTAWIVRHFRAEKKNISPALCGYLLQRCGSSMTRLDAEIAKICAYSGADDIVRADIDAVVEPTLEAVVFEITDALGVLDDGGCPEVTILHCNTQYPTPYEDANLTAMIELYEQFGLAGNEENPLYAEKIPVTIRLVSPAGLVEGEVLHQMERAVNEQKIMEIPKQPPREAALKELVEERFAYQYPYEKEKQIPVKVTVSQLKKAGMEESEIGKELFAQEELVPIVPGFLKKDHVAALTGSDRGTAYHRLLECLDYRRAYSITELMAQTEELIAEGKMTKEAAECIYFKSILAFAKSPVGMRMRNAFLNETLKREQPFVMSVPASEADPSYPEDETILVQGIIDAWFPEGDEIVLVDYKTDRVKEVGELKKRYEKQLAYYQQALERTTGKKVKEKIIYSLALDEELVL